MKAPPGLLKDAVKMARQLEVIQKDPNKVNSAEAAITEVQEAAGTKEDASVDQQIEALSASFQQLLQRRNNQRGGQRGRGGRGGRGQRGGRGGAQSNKTGYNTCRFCKKTGHLQKVCNARIKAGAPEVDDKGQPYRTGQNEIDDDQDQQETLEAVQGSIAHTNFVNNPWSQTAAGWQGWEANKADFC